MPFIKFESIVFHLKVQVYNSIPSSFSHPMFEIHDFIASIEGSCSLTSFDDVTIHKIGQYSLRKKWYLPVLFYCNNLHENL